MDYEALKEQTLKHIKACEWRNLYPLTKNTYNASEALKFHFKHIKKQLNYIHSGGPVDYSSTYLQDESESICLRHLTCRFLRFRATRKVNNNIVLHYFIWGVLTFDMENWFLISYENLLTILHAICPSNKQFVPTFPSKTFTAKTFTTSEYSSTFITKHLIYMLN